MNYSTTDAITLTDILHKCTVALSCRKQQTDSCRAVVVQNAECHLLLNETLPPGKGKKSGKAGSSTIVSFLLCDGSKNTCGIVGTC